MLALGFKAQSEGNLRRFADEIQKSFEIEGEKISGYSLRSSIARHLGLENVILNSGEQLDKPRTKVDAIVQIVTDAVNNCQLPLTEERLFGWHQKLFHPNSVGMGFNGLYSVRSGSYRTDEEGPMRVVSGNGRNETVHFEAPPAQTLPDQLRQFIEWVNAPASETPGGSAVKSAVSHLYFVTLHPFEDGNGRLARAIADMVLCRGDSTEKRVEQQNAGSHDSVPVLRSDHLFSMSAQLCRERSDYYSCLESTQRQESLDITQWIQWYLGCMDRAVLNALTEIEQGQKRARFWDYAESAGINDRQRKMLSMLLDDFKGKLTSTKYAKICSCSHDTASRDIARLVNIGLLRKGESGGRSTEYLFAGLEVSSGGIYEENRIGGRNGA